MKCIDFQILLSSDLVKQLQTATSKYDMNYVRDYYNNIEIPDGPFGFSHVHELQIILEKFDTNKAAGSCLNLLLI